MVAIQPVPPLDGGGVERHHRLAADVVAHGCPVARAVEDVEAVGYPALGPGRAPMTKIRSEKKIASSIL